ncbi:MAG TPA: ribosome-associated translation inhibitor RaiA [Arenibaculum sp.]|nr:ribosome-associated translation inhibitor RaiA [Arenibaculum sp.]
MHLTVKGKQIDVGDALRTHVGETLNALVGKYFGRPIEADVVISRNAHLFTADISVHAGRNILLQSSAEATEPYPAFDTAADKIAKRLRRYKRRLRDHHREDGHALQSEFLSATDYVLEAEPEDPPVDSGPDSGLDSGHAEGVGPDDGHDRNPVVIAEMEVKIETLTVSEAVMRMDLAERPAVMFRNRAHGGLNMVYRRPDGHVGWIDPKGTKGTDA